MKIRNLIYIPIIFSLIIAGTYLYEKITRDYIDMADEITAEVESILIKRYNMRTLGFTGGMMGSIYLIGLEFEIQGPLSKERLREIVVDCVEEFLAPINANEEIRPYLRNYPFTEKEIKIKLFVVDLSRKDVYEPYFMIASAFDGKVYYKSKDKNLKYGYTQDIEEDYQTALKIVRESTQK